MPTNEENQQSSGFGLRPHQLAVFQNTARFRVVVAGRRFGKTQLALAEILRAAAPGNRRIWYVAPTYDQAKSIFWERLKNATRPYWATRPSETELTVRLYNNSTISLRGADRPDSNRGNGLDFVVLDEFASMRPSVWIQVIRPALADRNGGAVFLGTPQGCNHFFDVYQNAQVIPQWAAFQFTTAQGGNVSSAELISAAAELDPESYKQEFEAAFTGVGLHRVYYAFDRQTNVKSLDFLPHAPLVWSLDFNVNPMCMLLMQRQDSAVHVLEEMIIKPDANTLAACEAFHKRAQALTAFRPLNVEVYGDASGNHRRTSATVTDWALIRQFFSTWVGVYKPSFHTSTSNPAVRDRINCVNARLCNSLGECRLFINPACRELIKDLEQVAWALDSSGVPTSEIDKSDPARTHCSDALGYYVAQAFSLRPTIGPNASGRLV
jgi:hypothetical protein